MTATPTAAPGSAPPASAGAASTHLIGVDDVATRYWAQVAQRVVRASSSRLARTNVRRADHIVVLREGRITEHGTHDDLVTTGGEYAELFTLHASAYRTQ